MEKEKEEEKEALDLTELANRLDTDPELKDDVVIKPLWDKLVARTQAVMQKERKLEQLRQAIGEDRGAAKALLDIIGERVKELDKKVSEIKSDKKKGRKNASRP